MKKLILVLLFIFIMPVTLAGMINYSVVEDAYTYNQDSGVNYNNEKLYVQHRPVLNYVMNTFIKPEHLPLVETDNAILWIYAYDLNEWTDKTIYIERVTSTWNESSITWDTMPTTISSIEKSVTNALYDGGNWIPINITSIVQNWTQNGEIQYGVKIVAESNGNSANNEILFINSSEESSSLYTPKLEINAINVTNVTVIDSITKNQIHNPVIVIEKYGTYNNAQNNVTSLDFLAKSSLLYNITISATGYDDTVHLNYNLSNNSTLTISKKSLELTFSKPVHGKLQEEKLITENGLTSIDFEALFRAKSFSDTELLIAQTALNKGDVLISFGEDDDNHTQFYEYYNNQDTTIIEDIKIINISELSPIWLQIKNTDNYVIDNAIVRIVEINATQTSFNDANLIGQRLSRDDGLVPFYADLNQHIGIIIQRDNYASTLVSLHNVKDLEETDKNNPYVIVLDRSNNVFERNAYIDVPTNITNLTTSFVVKVYAIGKNEYNWTTDYQQAQTGNAQTGDFSNAAYEYFLLERGTHYNSSSITFNIVLDDTVYTYDINIIGIEPVHVWNVTNLHPLLLGIFALLISVAISFIIKNEDTGYWALGIIASLFSFINPLLLWVAVPILLDRLLSLTASSWRED